MEFVFLAIVLLLLGAVICPSVRKEELDRTWSIVRGLFILLIVIAFFSGFCHTDVRDVSVDTKQMPLISVERTSSLNKELSYSYINYMDDVAESSAPGNSYSFSYIENWDCPHVDVVTYTKAKDFYFGNKIIFTTYMYDSEYIFHVKSNSPNTI